VTTFPKAKREGVQVLLGIAGPSSSGKTLSALRVASGLAGGKPFVFVDTENGRALHYADDFDFYHADLGEPFSPAHYREVIAKAAADKPPVIVIDSMTHEHTGVGGVLAMHEAELDRRAGDDFKKREALNMSAWIKPKAERKMLIADLLRLRCHVILCFRAEEKVDIVPDPQKPGKTKIVPKKTLAGHVGWIPVCGKEYPYELTMSLVVTPDAPGVPKPIKIMDKHRPMVPLDQPLSEDVGRRLAEWASGSSAGPEGHGLDGVRTASPDRGTGTVGSGPSLPPSETDELAAIEDRLLEHADKTGVADTVTAAIAAARREKSPAQFAVWLRKQGRLLDEKLAGSAA
jgi:hypothetical protein